MLFHFTTVNVMKSLRFFLIVTHYHSSVLWILWRMCSGSRLPLHNSFLHFYTDSGGSGWSLNRIIIILIFAHGKFITHWGVVTARDFWPSAINSETLSVVFCWINYLVGNKFKRIWWECEVPSRYDKISSISYFQGKVNRYFYYFDLLSDSRLKMDLLNQGKF